MGCPPADAPLRAREPQERVRGLLRQQLNIQAPLSSGERSSTMLKKRARLTTPPPLQQAPDPP